MSTKQWVVSQLDCIPQEGDYTDVVVIVHWRRIATEIVEGKDYFADVYGTQSFSSEDIQDFTPYDELTFDQVCGWLDSSLDVVTIDESLDRQIENQINPPIVSPPLPWSTPTTSRNNLLE
jgi:hypothetical protein